MVGAGRVRPAPGPGTWRCCRRAGARPVRGTGGKTAQLAAAGAHVTALDKSPSRMARLRGNLERLRLAAETVVDDALTFVPASPFDAVLLDAPCSATGTIRRNPDLPHIKDETVIQGLADLQARFLARAANFVCPGGILLYCTARSSLRRERARWPVSSPKIPAS